MDTSNIIALVATVISFGAFLLAGKSYQNSRMALQITEAEFEDKNKSIQAYLIDSFSFHKETKKYCSFAISYTNIASSPQSFASLELELEFFDEDGVYGKAIVPPDSDVVPLGISNEYKVFCVPLNISPKETVSGWITFLLPLSTHKKFRIDSYKVIGKTAQGKESYVDSYLIRTVQNEEES